MVTRQRFLIDGPFDGEMVESSAATLYVDRDEKTCTEKRPASGGFGMYELQSDGEYRWAGWDRLQATR